ncbi:NAD(P)-binding protein [Linnemannia elongata AG-77]|uniref:NAD(P)-binding protein n=1 Tax=Linnemannia elongata AG-77 TaxID=1314771 RepID=A0A197KIG2_9FUNG|nr:NAD(P)-binding protein [Linnemannia elongata AG-77]
MNLLRLAQHRIPANPVAARLQSRLLPLPLPCLTTPSIRFSHSSSSSSSSSDDKARAPYNHIMSSRLLGKNVLITGASSGIGEACARHFAQAGSNLLLAARRKDRLEKLKKDLESQHPQINIRTFELDVRNRAKVQATAATFGDIDVLVNNAGLVIGLEKLEDITEEAMDTMIDTNVKGLVHVTQAVLPGMRARDKGHIINIGSVAGQQAYGNGSIYCGSKAAVASISKALLFETIDTAIRISEINPGMVETEFSVVRFKGDKSKADSVYKGVHPLDGNDIAETVIFVAGRPEHVNIAEMLVFPTNQAAATTVYRKP